MSVYVIAESDNGPCKIGSSGTPDERCDDLQTGNPRKLSVVHVERTADMGRAVLLEFACHDVLEEQRIVLDDGRRTEWFNVPVSTAIETVRRVADSLPVVTARLSRRPARENVKEIIDYCREHGLFTKPNTEQRPEINVAVSMVQGGPKKTRLTGLEIAKCVWNGQAFQAHGPHGAVNTLARQLESAGAPDCRLNLYADGKHVATIASSKEAATITYAEGDRPLRRVPYRPNPHAQPATGVPLYRRFGVSIGETKEKACPGCGVHFQAEGVQRYCSAKCRLAKWRDQAPQPPRPKRSPDGVFTEAVLTHLAQDTHNVGTLERLWALWRAGGDDNAELVAALDIAPELVRARFRKDRSLGRTSS